jgi:group I intron endonuclease
MKITDKNECDIIGDTSKKKDKTLSTVTIADKKSGIYKIVNKTNGIYYVGRSSNIRKRIGEHIRRLEHDRHYNVHLQNSWNKYGKHNFEFVVVEDVIGNESLVNTEQYFLDVARAETDKCYNQTFISNYTEMTDEVKQKISNSLMGDKNVRYGTHHTKETLQKMSQSSRGKCLSEEHRNKNKMINKGRKFINRRRPSEICILHNIFTNETFSGTRTEFCHRFHIPSNQINKLFHNPRRHVGGWSLAKS